MAAVMLHLSMELPASFRAQTCCTLSRIAKFLMVPHGTRGKRAGKGNVRTSGSICLIFVDGSVCHNIPAESAKTLRSYVIHLTDDVNSGGSESETPRCFWMQMIIP